MFEILKEYVIKRGHFCWELQFGIIPDGRDFAELIPARAQIGCNEQRRIWHHDAQDASLLKTPLAFGEKGVSLVLVIEVLEEMFDLDTSAGRIGEWKPIP